MPLLALIYRLIITVRRFENIYSSFIPNSKTIVLLSILIDYYYIRSKFKSSLLLLRTIVVSLSTKQLYIDRRTTFERNNTLLAVTYTRLVEEVLSYYKIINFIIIFIKEVGLYY